MPVLNWFQIGSGAIAAFALSWLLHTVDVQRIEAKQRDALARQEVNLHAECGLDKQLTTGVSNGFEAKITSLNRQLINTKLLYASAACVPVTGTAERRNGSTRTSEPVRSDGVPIDTLLDFAAEAEHYRLQLISCQEFISKTWAVKSVSLPEATRR